jgi:hypothetical protein
MISLQELRLAEPARLTRLSQFEAIFGYFEAEITGKPNALNTALPRSVVVKTYPLS